MAILLGAAVAVSLLTSCAQEETGAPQAPSGEDASVTPEEAGKPQAGRTEDPASARVDPTETADTKPGNVPPAPGGETGPTDLSTGQTTPDATPAQAGEAATPETSPPVPAQPAGANAADPAAFGLANIEAMATDLAAKPFEPSPPLPKAAADLDYDQFRRIQNTPGSSLWEGDSLGYHVSLDPRGYLFGHEVKINVVDENGVAGLPYDASQFNFFDLPLNDEVKSALGYSGFRILSPFNRAGKFDEALSFRGASFFRALGAGTVYGASARGMSIGTASSEGEEFPYFREFWIVKPQPGDAHVTVYALLDGESVTGAFEFRIEPGPDTTVEVSATITPRRRLENFGVVPLTSMYHFSPHDITKQAGDFRPAVHDSQGLSFRLKNGEWVWRPLTNPQDLQVSVLATDVPRGFGLMQRKRDFDAYSDIEAAYHLRPSVWVEPGKGWARGELTLVEIPTTNEYNDNIVVFWKPGEAWQKGEARHLSYKLHWSLRPPAIPDVIAVKQTRTGRVPDSDRQLFVLDFDPADAALLEGVDASVSTSAGTISNPIIKHQPETGLTRLSFELDPGNAQTAELRALLTRGGKPVTETWIYRWRLP